MECLVIQIRKTKTGLSIAHVRIGPEKEGLYGDLPALPEVKLGFAQVQSKLVVKDGRLQAVLRVIPKE